MGWGYFSSGSAPCTLVGLPNICSTYRWSYKILEEACTCVVTLSTGAAFSMLLGLPLYGPFAFTNRKGVINQIKCH